MNYKKQFYSTLLITSIMLTTFASTIVYFDPFYQYHEPLNNLSYRPNMNLHSYTNPGVAKNFEYDTVVLGSSMTRTFSASYAKKMYDWNLVKLSIPEARGKDIKDMYSLIHEDTKTVIIGLDTFAYNVEADMEANEKPKYLWNQNPFDDVSYVFNKKLLTNLNQIRLDTKEGKPSYTMDEYQNWQEVLTIEPGSLLKWARDHKATEQFMDGTYDQSLIQANLNENLLSLIKNHPQQQFILYFPPYSIFYWMNLIETNKLDAELDEIEIIMKSVLPYENVQLFFPMDCKEIILDHEHYLDYLHYDTELSNKVIDQFDSDQDKVTLDTYQERLQSFRSYVTTYPYQTYIENEIIQLDLQQ